jgi:alpha-glucosidase
MSSLALLASLALWGTPPPQPSPVYRLSSPNGRIAVAVRAAPDLSYELLFEGKPLLVGATLALDVDHVRLGAAAKITGSKRTSVDRKLAPPVRLKSETLVDRYNELRLDCAGGYAVVFRAYDEGMAYRFETALANAQVKVYGEEAVFPFTAADTHAYFPNEGKTFFSHNEQSYDRVRVSDIPVGDVASLPVVVATVAGPKLAIAESDIESYPGLWLRSTGGPALVAAFPPYPLEEKATKDRDVKVVRAADFIAVTTGTRAFPWRLVAVAATDADLVTNSLVYLLQRPSQVADTSWIKPGKVPWDWWNDRNLAGVPFKPGINTDTYKFFIDFAARFGIEYVILDEGWYKTGNLLQVSPGIDMPQLLAYARAKNVGIILWAVWKTLADQMEPALAQFEKWGIKGLKVDFMQRDDQPVIDFYHRVAREAAQRKMLVDFHGGQRPALMTRTWPNIISTEGVKGLEHVKWSNAPDPEHDVTLPFTRMFLGPMDFTPGAMLNTDKANFKIVFKRPMSLGTRCHQLAMYVVYESPLQMLADSPTSYLAELDTMEFLRGVPTVWDETRVLDARIGDYIVVARRRGMDWFVGAMTDWTPRELDVDLSFLGGGRWTMTAFADGPDADRAATSYRRASQDVGKATRLKVKLAPGGGWAARVTAAPVAAPVAATTPGPAPPAAVNPDGGAGGAKPAKP